MAKVFEHQIIKDQYSGTGVGTSVTGDAERVRALVKETIEAYDWKEGEVPDPLVLPVEANELLSAGMVRRPEVGHYKIVQHRGEEAIVLDRTLVAKEVTMVGSVPVVVYDKVAFLGDPQVSAEDKAEFARDGYTHAAITFLAAQEGAPRPLVSSHRFVRNLAGGNAEYAKLTKGEIVALALAVAKQEEAYTTVG